ncbi:MAG: patatin-like phospholipase family protein, partial [Bryobacteraceae bacterium]
MSETTHLTWAEAFKEEIAVVEKRHLGPGKVEENLVGLAVSGGGIRSATFALGVLEGLKHFGLLPKIDYLSTVSGGGYIGAWLSANCKRAASHQELEWLDKESNWKSSVDHLRRYSNYLSPTLGFFSADTWSVGAIWLRNTILVQLTVILAIAVALLVPRPLFVVFEHWPR